MEVKYYLIEDYASMELMGVKGLFTKHRVESARLPDGYYKYSIREGYENVYSSSKREVFTNRVGDFICKGKIDLKGDDELELGQGQEYRFTHEKVDPDGFFGVDLKLLIAQELDSFVSEFDEQDYQSSIPDGCKKEEVIQSIRDGLDNKAYIEETIVYFQSFLDNDKETPFLPTDMKQKISQYVSILAKINEGNRDRLDRLINVAEEAKINNKQ